MLLLLRLEKFAILRWREFFWKIKKWSTISNGAVTKVYPFTVGEFDLELVKAGGWVNYADSKY